MIPCLYKYYLWQEFRLEFFAAECIVSIRPFSYKTVLKTGLNRSVCLVYIQVQFLEIIYLHHLFN